MKRTAAFISLLLALSVVSLPGAKPDTSVGPEEKDAEGNATDYKNPIRDGLDASGRFTHYHVTICEGTTLGPWHPWGSAPRNREPRSNPRENVDDPPLEKGQSSHAAATSAGGTDGGIAISGKNVGTTTCTVSQQEDDGTVNTVVITVRVIECNRANRGARGIRAGLTGLPSLGTLLQEGRVETGTIGTGETIGHVVDLTIRNVTDKPVKLVVPPMILESKSGKSQHYAAPESKTVELGPKQSKTVPIDGVCLVRNKPPVKKGASGDLVFNEVTPKGARNPDAKIESAKANKLLRIAHSKYKAADKLLKEGKLKDMPYSDKKKQKETVVQWATWMDPVISEITGVPPATKDDLKKVVYKQAEKAGPVTPEKKKKLDEGIDTIFEKIELTGKEAKELEEASPDKDAELKGSEEGASPTEPKR